MLHILPSLPVTISGGGDSGSCLGEDVGGRVKGGDHPGDDPHRHRDPRGRREGEPDGLRPAGQPAAAAADLPALHGDALAGERRRPLPRPRRPPRRRHLRLAPRQQLPQRRRVLRRLLGQLALRPLPLRAPGTPWEIQLS